MNHDRQARSQLYTTVQDGGNIGRFSHNGSFFDAMHSHIAVGDYDDVGGVFLDDIESRLCWTGAEDVGAYRYLNAVADCGHVVQTDYGIFHVEQVVLSRFADHADGSVGGPAAVGVNDKFDLLAKRLPQEADDG